MTHKSYISGTLSSGFRAQDIESHSKTFLSMSSRAKISLGKVIQDFVGVPRDDFSLHFS